MKKIGLFYLAAFFFYAATAQTNYNFPVQAKIENGIIEGKL